MKRIRLSSALSRIAKAIKTHCEKSGITMQQFAKQSSISHASLCALARGGGANPTLRSLLLLSHALQMSIDEMVGGRDA